MFISIDVGSTKTRIAGSRDLEHLLDQHIEPTRERYDEAIAYIVGKAREIAGDEPIEALAIDIPGRLSRDRRSIYKLTFHPDWNGKAIADDLERALSTRVFVENDTGQVGCGEAVFGAGRGARIVVYMTVSTGVNAVRIVDGAIEPSVYRTETGFQYMDTSAKPAILMDLISGEAMEKKYGQSPKEFGTDDPIWEEFARFTAFGIHNSILHWSPERVVLGGSMFNEVGISVERVGFHLREIMQAFPEVPDIVHAELGDVGGLWGGLALLRQQQ